MTNVKIILGSTRQNRIGDKVAWWIHDLAMDRADFKVELIDIKDYPLPFFDELEAPEVRPARNTVAQALSQKMQDADGFIFVVPEYNHSFPGVLKNMLDHLYKEWNKKPVAFVGYSDSQSGGLRAIEQLRSVAIELQMAPIRDEIAIPNVSEAFDENGQMKESIFEKQALRLFKQLSWWTDALKKARTKENKTHIESRLASFN